MGLDNISRSVLEAANKEAEHILKAAKLAADETIASAKAAAEQDGERKYQAAVRAIEEELGRQLIQVRGAANKELLAKKNQRLREVFDTAHEQILAFPENEYAGIMQGLLEKSAAEGGGAVRVHPDDEAVFSRLIEEINKGRSGDEQVKLDKDKPLEQRGGFVFVGESYEVDQTLGTLLADIERELAPKIAAELFAGRE